MSDEVTDQLIANDILIYGRSYVKFSIDEKGNLIRERISPLDFEMEDLDESRSQ